MDEVPDASPRGSCSHGGLLAGVIILSLLLLAVIIGAIVLLYLQRKK